MAIKKPRRKPLNKYEIPTSNPLKNVPAEDINYKNVDLLKKFIHERGKIRSREITGVTVQQQRLIASAIKNARELALLPFTQQVHGLKKGRR
jgi:small subunit ribosomal protein S18